MSRTTGMLPTAAAAGIPVLALIVASPAHAHVKWFAPYIVGASPSPIGNTLMDVWFWTAAGLVLVFFIATRRSKGVLPACCPGWTGSAQRKKPHGRPDEEALTADIIGLAARYGRYGYRRITAMLRSEGWTVNAKRAERIWRREGLKVPQKQPKKGRLC
jgi:hypothetical protein